MRWRDLETVIIIVLTFPKNAVLPDRAILRITASEPHLFDVVIYTLLPRFLFSTIVSNTYHNQISTSSPNRTWT
jgi:hypothetical protein